MSTNQFVSRRDNREIDNVVSGFLDATNYSSGTPDYLDKLLTDAVRLPLCPHDHAIVLQHAADGAMNKYSFGEPNAARAVIDKHLAAWTDRACGFKTAPVHFVAATMWSFAQLKRGPSDEFIVFAQKMAKLQIGRYNEREVSDLYGAMAQLAVTFDQPFLEALAARTPAATQKLSGEDLFYLLHHMAIVDAVATISIPGYKSELRNTFIKMSEDTHVLNRLKMAHSQDNLRMLRDATFWFTGERIKFHSPGVEHQSQLELRVMEHFRTAGGDVLSPTLAPDTAHAFDITVSFKRHVGLVECDGEPFHFNRWPGAVIRLDGMSVLQSLIHGLETNKPIVRLPCMFEYVHREGSEGWTTLGDEIAKAKPGAYIVTPEGALSKNLLMPWPLFDAPATMLRERTP